MHFVTATALGILISGASIGAAAAIGGPSFGDGFSLFDSRPRCQAVTGATATSRVMDWDGSDRASINLRSQASYTPGTDDRLQASGDPQVLAHLRIRNGTVEMDCRGWQDRTKDLVITLPGRPFNSFRVSGGGLALDRLDQENGTTTTRRQGIYDFWKDPEGFSLVMDRTHGLQALDHAGTIAEILRGRSWYLLEAVEGYFITSDQPVERATPAVNGAEMDGAFMNPLTEVTFPLSPRLCLLVTGQRLPNPRLPVGRGTVRRLNEIRARYAERMIWSHVLSDDVIELCRTHGNNRLEMSFSNQAELPEIEIARPRFV